MIVLDKEYSTTRRVIKAEIGEITELIQQAVKPEDKFKTRLFLSTGVSRKSEGGLRTKGYFKVGGLTTVCNAYYYGQSEECLPDLLISLNDKQSKSSRSNTKNSILEKKPLITVITVVYNGERFLEETILSVINQTYDNVEYIIIDGGSTDGTLDIIKKYDYAIDYWVSEKDKGIYDAMNKGIELATGSWMNFLNAGDSFSKKNILKDHILPLNSHVNIIYGSCNVRTDINVIQLLKPKKLKRVNLFLWGTRVVCHQAIFVKREIIIKYSLAYELKGELNWYLKLSENRLNYKIIDEAIVEYSLGGKGDVKYFKNFIEALIVSFRNNIFLGWLSMPLLLFKLIKRVFK